MKKFILIPLLFICSIVSAQLAETHNFTEYDTTYNGPTGTWLMRISRPVNMFTVGNADTASRPMIFTIPGQGEMGNNNPNNVLQWGPHYWRTRGWDGSVALGNGVHYPILVTATFVNNQFPTEQQAYEVLTFLLSHYHIKANGVHVAGLSQGAFMLTALIAYEVTTGDEAGQKIVTSLTALQGMVPVRDSAWANWAKKYHGKFFGLEGTGDFRNVAQGEKDMNNGTKGSAHFSYENSSDNQNFSNPTATATAGSHCCWNSMYNPNQNNWQSFPPMGPLVATGTDTNARGSYLIGSSIFQWMLRQGDTTMVNPVNAFFVNKVIPCEYVTFFKATDNNLYKINGQQVGPIMYDPSGHTVIDAAGGFNDVYLIDEANHVWTDFGGTYNQVTTDTTGAAFNSNASIWAGHTSAVSIKTDGSAWYFGQDSFQIYHSGPLINMRPTPFGVGHTWKKIVFGGFNRIVGLTTTGDVYQFNHATGPNGVKMTPVGAIAGAFAVDIAASHLDYAIALYHDYVGGDSTQGYPYVWGTDFGAWSATPQSPTQPTNQKTQWGLTMPIREIGANWNTIHYIDSIRDLHGMGFNVQGEVGNGIEFVNRYTYITYPGYGWDFNDHENPTFPPQTIAHNAKHVWKQNNYFTFSNYYSDMNDSIYSWGRDKSVVLGDGHLNLNEEQSPNALDTCVPRQVHPLATGNFKKYNFTGPTVSISGGNQTIGTSFFNLIAAGHSALLINSANNTDTLGYPIVSYSWTKTSGGSATIVCPTCNLTQVTGLSNGIYKFKLITVNSNNGQDSAVATITVAISSPTANAGPDQSISLPTNSVTLNGSGTAGAGHSLVAFAWTKKSGPASGTIVTPNAASTQVTNLVQGVYIFTLTVTDDINQTATDDVQITVNSSQLQISGIIKRKVGTKVKIQPIF